MTSVTDSPLGKQSSYISQYQPDLLFPVPRKLKRDEILVPDVLPFEGVDIWNGFEISWLNAKGKPMAAVGEFVFPCHSSHIIESKSFKLYLNSFNNDLFDSLLDVQQLMQRDLSAAAGLPVSVKLVLIADFPVIQTGAFSGVNLDLLDIVCDTYQVNPGYLSTSGEVISEVVCSDLLKSNCLVTGQPDWGSVQIQYTGKKISHEGLLKYIVSFRNHNEFHEQCIERIFMDIMRQCAPEQLTVHGRYTRRGGLDINPFRSTQPGLHPENLRLCRQ